MNMKIIIIAVIAALAGAFLITAEDSQESDAAISYGSTYYWGGIQWVMDQAGGTITISANNGTGGTDPAGNDAATELSYGGNTPGYFSRVVSGAKTQFLINGASAIVLDDTVKSMVYYMSGTNYGMLSIGKNVSSIGISWDSGKMPGSIQLDPANAHLELYEGNLYQKSGADLIPKIFVVKEGITTIQFPSNMKGFSNSIPFYIASSGGNNFYQYFSISEEAPNYKTVDGVLFTKDGKNLCWYPPSRPGTLYEVPVPVEIIDQHSFYGMKNLTSIKLPSTFNYIYKAWEGTSQFHSFDTSEVTNEWTGYSQFLRGMTLNYLDLTNCVTLGNNAFGGSTIDLLILPASLKLLGEKCFTQFTTLVGNQMPYVYNLSTQMTIRLADGNSPFYSVPGQARSSDLFDITASDGGDSKIATTGALGDRAFNYAAGIRIHLQTGDVVWAFTKSATNQIHPDTLTRAIAGQTVTGYYWDSDRTNPISNINTQLFYATTDGTAGGTATYGKIYDVYASSTPANYSVRFNVNSPAGTSPSGTMANQAFTYGVEQNLNANAFSISGYAFAGWATSAAGNVQYTDGALVKNLTKVNGGIVDLYAKWSSGPFIIYLSSSSTSYGTVKIQGSTANYIADIPALTGIQPLGDMVTIGDWVVLATPAESTSQWDYAFAGWTLDGADLSDMATVSGDMQLQGVFVRTQHVDPVDPDDPSNPDSHSVKPTGEEDLDLFTAYRAQNTIAETKSSESDFEVDEVAIAAGAVCAVAACLGMALIPKP